MPDQAMHRRYEQILARTLRTADPVRALHRQIAKLDPQAPLAIALQTVDPDGLRITALLVARLRFERLIQGSQMAARWFEQDAVTFAKAFRSYHARTPMRAFFPREEAEDFARFWKKQSFSRK